MPIAISSTLDGGNIKVLAASSPADIRLEIVHEPYTDAENTTHFQLGWPRVWLRADGAAAACAACRAAARPAHPLSATPCRWFHFRLTGARGVPLTLHIVNAGRSSFPEAWPGYQACASSDYQHWCRVRTSYDAAAGVLTIQHTPEHDIAFFAYFAPFPLMWHQLLVAGLADQRPDLVRCEVLGQTLEGRDIDLLTLGGCVRACGRAGGWVGGCRSWLVRQLLLHLCMLMAVDQPAPVPKPLPP